MVTAPLDLPSTPRWIEYSVGLGPIPWVLWPRNIANPNVLPNAWSVVDMNLVKRRLEICKGYLDRFWVKWLNGLPFQVGVRVLGPTCKVYNEFPIFRSVPAQCSVQRCDWDKMQKCNMLVRQVALAFIFKSIRRAYSITTPHSAYFPVYIYFHNRGYPSKQYHLSAAHQELPMKLFDSDSVYYGPDFRIFGPAVVPVYSSLQIFQCGFGIFWFFIQKALWVLLR